MSTILIIPIPQNACWKGSKGSLYRGILMVLYVEGSQRFPILKIPMVPYILQINFNVSN